jgi:hypothetical protein
VQKARAADTRAFVVDRPVTVQTASPPPRYVLDRPDIAAAEAELTRLWRENLELRGDVADKFRWTCRDAPSPPLGELILRAGAEPTTAPAVGCIGVMPRSFVVGGRAIRAALLGDLAVDKKHRSLMPALTLVRGARRLALAEAQVSYGLPNRAALGVLKHCGYRELGDFTRWARVLRHAKHLRRMVGVPVVPDVAGSLVDGVRLAGMAPRAAVALSGASLQWLDRVDDRFDRLWREASPDYDIVGERTAAFLSWRFLRHPEDRCRIAALVSRGRGSSVRAYAVLDRSGDLARIRDLFGRREDVGHLLDLLLPALVFEGFASVSIRYLGSNGVLSLLTDRGFTAREVTCPIVYDVAADSGLDRDALRSPERWHLTDADEDI